jgi:putative ABC transport system permease protein
MEVVRQMREMLGSEARVLTRSEMLEAEKAFMKLNDPVDDIMGMIAGVAFFVGMIIVYQILYTDVVNHLPQFATLKAIGFTGAFLLGIIIAEGVILSLIGFWPGLLMAHGLAWLAQQATLLPVSITLGNTVGVLLAAIVMCVLAASIAVRKITQAEPASVF